MATIQEGKDRLQQAADSGTIQLAAPSPPTLPTLDLEPDRNPFLRTPMPAGGLLHPDIQRQFFEKAIPQVRILQPAASASPQINATAQTVATTIVSTTPSTTPSTSTDNDLIQVNLQTGTSYTVQLSDLNKLISISNAAGGTVYLPPVAGSVTVAITNTVSAPFNSGNTVGSGSGPTTETSTFVFTPTKPVNVGDFMFLGIRNVSSHSDGPSVAMSDNHNGAWTSKVLQIDNPAVGTDTLSLFYVQNRVASGSFTLVFSATYPTTGFNPDSNALWTMTGIKNAAGAATFSALSSGSTVSSGGLTINATPTTFVSAADSQNGDISPSPFSPANSQGKAWTALPSSNAGAFNVLTNINNGFVNDVYTLSASGFSVLDILQAFTQAQPNDITKLPQNFFCYVENTGTGVFNLVSSAPIDGVVAPVSMAQNTGTLLVWDINSNGWYTERGLGSGGGVFPLNTPAVTHKFFNAYNNTTGAFTQTQPSSADLSDKDAANGVAGLDANTMLKLPETTTSINAQTGTTYTVADSDRAKVVTFSNSSAVAVTLPQAGASSQFVSGWFGYFLNRNTGIVTITPTTSTINGNAALVLQKNQGVYIASDGTNYVVLGTILGDQNGTLTDGFLLSYDGTNHKWIAVSPGSISGINAVQLRGINIATSASAPGNQNVLRYSSANNDWEPVLLDGMEHGDSVWWADPAYIQMQDDFIVYSSSTIFPTSAVTGPLGILGWTSFGSLGGAAVPRIVGGNPPHGGIIEWGNLATSNGYGGLILNALLGTNTPWLYPKALPLLENPGWKVRWVWKWSGDVSSSANNPVSFAKKSFYMGLAGAAILAVKPATSNSWTSTSARPDHFIGVRYETATVPAGWGLTSVANASAGTTVYTISGANGFNGGTNTFVNCTVVVRGCTNAANNGTFTCTASSTTTVTLNNASGVSETVPNTASMNITNINITAVTANSPVAGKSTFTYVNTNSTTSPGANGGYIGISFTGSGFTNGGNNVTATCVGSTATTIILNTAGVTETPTANAAFLAPAFNGPDSTMKLEVVDNAEFTTGARHGAQGTTFDTGITPVAGNWYRLEMDCTATGQVVMTVYDENNATNATHTFTVSQLALATASTSWSTNASKMAFGQPGADAPSANSNVPVNQILPFVAGSSVTISGFTSPLNVLNATWTLEEANDGAGSVGTHRIWFFSNNANVGPASQTSTFTGYPALTPFVVWGDDDTGANGGTTTYPGPTHIQIDEFLFAWNKAIASPSTVPSSAKSRYW